MDNRGVYAVMSNGLIEFLASCRGVCRFHLAHTHLHKSSTQHAAGSPKI